jgi:hypothetical protein
VAPVEIAKPASQTSAGRLVTALSYVEPGLHQLVAEREAKEQEAGRALAMAQNYASESELKAALTTEQTVAFQRGMTEVAGQNAAFSARRRALAELDQNADEYARGNLDFNELVKKHMSLEGIQDETFRNAAMPLLFRFRQEVAEKHQANTLGYMERQGLAQIGDLLRGGLEAERSPTPELLAAVAERGRSLGLNGGKVNEAVVIGVTQAAIEQGRPELVDLLEAKRPDGTPGPASIPRFMERVRTARAQAERVRDGEVSKADEVAQRQGRTKARRLAEQGMYSEAQADADIKDGLYNAAYADQQLANSEATKLKLEQVHLAGLAVRAGDRRAYESLPKFAQDKAAQAWATEKLAQYQAASTPQDRNAVLAEMVDKGVDLGITFEPIKSAIANATPDNAQGFKAAAELYTAVRAHDPYYASKHADKSQQHKFDVYELTLRTGGNEQQALEAARNLTPDNIAKARAFFRSEDGRQAKKNLHAALSDAPGWFTGSMLNGAQASAEVLERAEVILAGNPSLAPEVAIDHARKAYEHENIKLGRLWIPKKFADLPNAEDVIADVLRTVPEQLQALNMPALEGDYMLAPDFDSARDGRLQLYDPRGLPVVGVRFSSVDLRNHRDEKLAAEYDDKAREKNKDNDSPVSDHLGDV